MELLEGEALSARIKRLSRLDERSTIDIAMQTALGLGAAHAKGITHRDLKPDNLFIIPEPADASRERVKILDFGIAKLHKLAGDSLKTRTGTLMGTPVYMSPEQCLGTKEVDHRSDVYSLGIIIYEMLAGQPTFVSEGFGELLSMHLHEPPAPLRQFAPQVSHEIEQVILRMLAKKPEERFQSMAEVRAALAEAGRLPNAVSPEHKLGSTDRFGESGTMATQTRHPKPKTLPPTTLTPGGMVRDEPPDTTVQVRKKPWLAIGIGAAAIAVAAVAAVVLRKEPPPPPAVTKTTAEVVPMTAPAKVPKMVRMHLESTPAGARVVRVSDDVVLGTTPETIELRSSADPLLLRLEKEGFAAATKEVSLAGDSNLSVMLEALAPTPATPGPGSGPKKRGGSRSQPAPERGEPAKL
jgi:serine/threonine-protein kinase